MCGALIAGAGGRKNEYRATLDGRGDGQIARVGSANRRPLFESCLPSSDFCWLCMCSPSFLFHVQPNRAALERTFLFSRSLRTSAVGPFLYRCPNTGFRVQGWVEDDDSEDGERYEGVICHSCGRRPAKQRAATISKPHRGQRMTGRQRRQLLRALAVVSIRRRPNDLS